MTGPAFPKGYTFGAYAISTGDAQPVPPGVPLTMVELGPSEVSEADIALSRWCPITTPGDYTIVMSLDHGGVRARSNELSFAIEALDARGASVGIDEGASAPASLVVAFVHAGAGQDALYDTSLVEDRPDLGELARQDLARRRDLEPGVGVVWVPWCNTDRMTLMADWRVWLAGDRLMADGSPLGEPFALPVPAGSHIAPPAWQDAADHLAVLLLDPDRRHLAVARFSGPDPRIPTGQVAWRGAPEGPGSIVAARAALGPAPDGDPLRAVALIADGDDVRVAHFRAGVGSPGTPSAEATFRRARAVPGALTVRVSTAGVTRVRFLADDLGARGRVYLASIDFDERGRQVGPGRVDPVVDLEEPVRDAALELALHDRDDPELAWVVAIDDRRALWSRGDDRPQWIDHPGLVRPLQLLPLSQATYLAVIVPGRAPDFLTLGE